MSRSENDRKWRSEATGAGIDPGAGARVARLLLSLSFVCLLWLGFATSVSHSHDGATAPASCAVCHVGAEPALDVPGASFALAVAAAPDVSQPCPTAGAAVSQPSIPARGPRAPPA